MPTQVDIGYGSLTDDQFDQLFTGTPAQTPSQTPPVTPEPVSLDNPNLDTLLPPELPVGAQLEDPLHTANDNAPVDLEDYIPEGGVPAEAAPTNYLKNMVDYYVENGLWEDFEGREELEYTNEVVANLAEAQQQWRDEKRWEDTLDLVGPIGKQIYEYRQAGGDAEDMLSIFQQERDVQAYDKTTEEGKKQFLASYYKDVKGLDKAMIDRQIKALVLDDQLDAEVTAVDTQYTEHFQQQRDLLQQQQKTQVEQQKKRDLEYEQSIKSELGTRSLSPKERQVLNEALLTFDYKLPNGKVTNRLYGKLAEIQNDPKALIDLADYLMNKETFMERINQIAETKATKKAFDWTRNGGTLSRKTGTANTIGRTGGGTTNTNLF